MKGCVYKIHQVKENDSKKDQRQCGRIAVDRFFKATLSLDRFLILACVPDRFFIGGIDLSLNPILQSRHKKLTTDFSLFRELRLAAQFEIY